MKKTLSYLFVVVIAACNTETVFTPDNSEKFQKQEDSSNQKFEIQSALNDLLTSRIDALDKRVTDLEGRLGAVEAHLDLVAADVVTLFSKVALLEQADIDIRQELADTAAELRDADGETRRVLTAKFRRLQRALSNEIGYRLVADANIQAEIDALGAEFERFEAEQTIINKLLARGLALAANEIITLEFRLRRLADSVRDNQKDVQAELAEIKGQIADVQDAITGIGGELESIKEKLVSVVYPCGQNEEALLKTQDGIVGVFSIGKNKKITFEDEDTIPAHAKCGKFVDIPSQNIQNACVKAETVPASTVTQKIDITYFSLEQVRLEVLGNGNYDKSDGWSCSFKVNNGEVVTK